MPGIHNRLVSCVDLSRPDREKERASAFFAKLVREALDRIKTFRPWSVVDRRRLTRAAIFGASALGAFALAFGVLPEAMSSAMARIFNPFADIAPATGVKFTVKPGNAKALRGEDVTIDVAMVRGRADDLRVELRRADGEGGTTWYDLDRPSESGGSLRLAGFESSFTYRVHGGGTWSPEYAITMLDRPAIASLSASVRYPAYMSINDSKPGTPQVGDVTGPEKSTVTVAVDATGDVATGSIQSLVGRATRTPCSVFDPTTNLRARFTNSLCARMDTAAWLLPRPPHGRRSSVGPCWHPHGLPTCFIRARSSSSHPNTITGC